MKMTAGNLRIKLSTRCFVTFISQDEQNKWATSNRSQAKQQAFEWRIQFEIGAIPKIFLKQFLSLKVSITKANIEYRIEWDKTK